MTHVTKSRCGLALVVCFATLALARAERSEQNQSPVFRSGADSVEVIAFAADRKGVPVRDLRREDFILEEDGVRQEISSFSLVDLPRTTTKSSATASNAAPSDVVVNKTRDDRSYVLVLDSQHVDPLRSGSVRQLAKKFVNDYMDPTDSAAVVTLGGIGGQTFTSDKRRLLAAIDSFAGGKSRSAALNKLDSQMRNSGDGPPRDYENAVKAADARILFESVRGICDSLGAFNGRRRSVILFSEGVEIDMSDMVGPRPTDAGADVAASSLPSSYAMDLLLAQRAMVEAARRSNVSLYTVDPRGTSVGEDSLMQVAGLPPGGGRGSLPVVPPTRDVQVEVQRSQGVLRLFAEQTGGLALVNTSDFDRGFGRVADANSIYYVIGYSSTNASTTAGFRRITVRVSRPGVEIAARPGYFVGANGAAAPGTTTRVDLKGASPRMQDLLGHAIPSAGLGIRAVALPIGRKGKDGVVDVVVELDSAAFGFADEGEFLSNTVEVGYVAIDSTGRIRAGRASAGQVKVRRTERSALSKGLRFVIETPLPAERYQIRVGALESFGGTSGNVVVDVDVNSKSDTMIAGLMIGAPNDQVPTSGDYPLLRSRLPLPPTTSRSFAMGAPMSVYVALNAGDTKRDQMPQISLVVTRPDGTEVVRQSAVRAATSTANGVDVSGATLELGTATLAPGSYRLQAIVFDGKHSETSQLIPFTVT